ncbi:MAG: hypothetical protein ACREF4_20180, partial [Gammaproteobacteria bacterium]
MGRYPGSIGALAGRSAGSEEHSATTAPVFPSGAPKGGLGPLVGSLRRHRRLGRELVHHAHLSAVAPRWRDLEPPPPPALREALAAGGVERLWRHQVEALD